MYHPGGGRRLSEWQGGEGSSGPYRPDSSLTQRVLGNSSWSFGGVHGTVAEHLPQQSSVQREELQSRGTFVPKQEYFTPPQRFLRGQHGTPITISSDGSLILDDRAPTRPVLKRAGSPSMMYQTPAKRQQRYESPGMIQPPRPIIDEFPNVSRQLYLEDQPEVFETQYVNEREFYQQEIPDQLSHSPYRQHPQVGIHHEQLPQMQPSGRPQYVSAHRDPSRRPSASHHLSPGVQFINRTPTRAPEVVQYHSPQQHWPSQHPLQQVSSYEPEGAHPQGQAQYRQYDQYDQASQIQREQFRPAMTMGRESQMKLENENSRQSPLGNEGRKQRAQLGSPLWPNPKAAQTDAQPLLGIRIQRRNVVPAGSTKIPEDQIDHRHISEIPVTPSRQRAKSPSVLSQRPPTIHRGRNKIVAPASANREASKVLHQNAPYQAPSVENSPDDDGSESTPLNEVLRRQQHQGQTIRSNFEEGSYKVADVLPQESIFGHDRSKTAEAKFASPQPPLQRTQEALILTTPNANAQSPSHQDIRSVPMKERITPAKKPPTKKSAATSKKTATRPKKSTPKTPKATKKQKDKTATEVPVDPTMVMQKRAADIIINKEIQAAGEAMDLDLFGEVVGMTEEEEKRKEEEMRAKAQQKLIEKTAELQAKEEADKLAEIERMRVKAEKEAKERLEKEVEEERAKARREADRKKQDALEERERDELRRKTAEKIEADRKKAAEETERREQLQREAKERAEKVQAEGDELAKLKNKQEEAKKQAASLRIAKISMSEDAEKAVGVNIDKDGEALVEEDSLFLPENDPKAPDTDDGSRAKSVGPTSAAQVFAQSDAKAKISRYRAEKEEAELQRQKLAKETRLSERWKRKEAKKAMQQAPPPESLKQRPTPSEAAKEEPPKSKSQSIMSPPPSEAVSTTESTVSQPLLPSITGTANSSFNSNKSAPAALPPLKPQVKLISQLELEKISREAHAKQAKDIASQKAKRTEEQKLERRKKEVEKTRAKQRQRLIDEAKQKGWERSENEIEAQVDTHLNKLEARRQRYWRERNAPKPSIHGSAPDNLILEALVGPRRQFSETTDSHASTIDDEEEELTLEEQVRRANEAAMKESMKALARQRNSSFARAAAKKTVADFQTDSESEEDPDPAPAKPSEKDNAADPNSDADSETYDEQAGALDEPNPDEHDAQIAPSLHDMTASFERHRQIRKQQPEISSAVRNLIDNPGVSEHQPVMLYTVKKEITFNGKEKSKPPILSQSFSRKEANDTAAAEVQKLRKRPTKSISEGYDDDDLYFATINYDREDKMQAYVYVTACPMSSGEIVDFDTAKVENRLPEKSWFVIQYITERKTDEETGEVHIHHNVPEFLGHFSQLEMANHEACTRLISLTKPTNRNLDHIGQHTEELAPRIREVRDKATEDRMAFEVEIDRDDEQLQWVSFDSVRMEVKLFPMKGPRN